MQLIDSTNDLYTLFNFWNECGCDGWCEIVGLWYMLYPRRLYGFLKVTLVSRLDFLYVEGPQVNVFSVKDLNKKQNIMKLKFEKKKYEIQKWIKFKNELTNLSLSLEFLHGSITQGKPSVIYHCI